MANSEGPWSGRRRPIRVAARLRYFLWLGLLAAGGLGIWKLSMLFPAPAGSGWDQVYLLRLIAILVFISSGVVFAREIRVSELLRNAALWSAVLAVLVLGYTYRGELQDIGLRVRSELMPGYPIATDPRTLILSAAEDGGYHVVGMVNGTPIEFLIDTGASDIVLSPADATRIGMDKKSLIFSHVIETAHGLGRGASSHVASLSIGPIVLSDVPVSINQSEMRNSLLGMAFLNRMDSFEVERNRLILRWRK